MRVRRHTIYTTIEERSAQEYELILSLLNEFEDGRTLLFEPASNGYHNDGFYSGLLPFLQQQGITIDFAHDDYPPQIPIKEVKVDPRCLIDRELRDYQVIGTRKTLHAGRGVIQAATGAGKTEMAAAAIHHLMGLGKASKCLVLTPTVFLMEQAADKLERFGLGKIGRLGGGVKRLRDNVLVSVVDSAYRALQRGGDFAQWIHESDLLILDEAHHASANMWATICQQCPAKYRLAYTATAFESPEKYSYDDLMLLGLIGPIIYEVRSKELRDRGYLAHPLVTFLYTKIGHIPVWEWSSVYNLGIVRSKVRNSLIISLVSNFYSGAYRTMIFVGRRSHGHALARTLASFGCDCVFVHGGSQAYLYYPSGKVERQTWTVEDIAAYINQRERAILITTTVLDEGLDVPTVNVLVMATGMKKYRRTIQRVGRGMRPKQEGSNRVFIFDFWDSHHKFLERQSEYRLWTYQEEEYDIAKALEETASLMQIPIELRTDITLLKGTDADEDKDDRSHDY